ncbi:MAG: hypothetical protein Q9207_004550 [Kuettlingeria erythrocarpa]
MAASFNDSRGSNHPRRRIQVSFIQTLNSDLTPKNRSPNSVSLSAPPHFPDPYSWRIPGVGSTKRLIFSNWSSEFPNFDDVISLIEKTELEIHRDINASGGDGRGTHMPKVKTWSFGTARLQVLNDVDGNDLTQREVLAFLQGLWESGMMWGFFGCHIQFYDSALDVSRRGKAALSRTASAMT